VPQARPAAEGENAVRILTIHKSKGLEFPMVIQCRMGKSFLKGGQQTGKVMMHRDVGIISDWEDYAAHTYKKTLLHTVIRQRGKMDKWAEETRLLYVGMTRAMDRLHLIGTVPDPEALTELYRDAIPEADIDFQGATNYLGMILPVICARRDCFDIEVVPIDCVVADNVDHWSSDLGNERVVLRDEDEDFLQAHRRANAGEAERDIVDSLPVATRGHADSRADVARALLREMFVAGRANPRFDERFNYCYPFESESRLKSKYSVTALSNGTAPRYFTEGSADEADEDAGLTAAERGTALHRTLELLDISEAYARQDDVKWFETWLSGLRTSEILTAAETESVSVGLLRLFAGSELCRRVAAADLCIKEAPFNMKMQYEGAEVVVQGVIDCLFKEADGWVVADYKSGRFAPGRPGEEARIREAYGRQIELYRQAARHIFEEPVKEALIYMTGAGACIVIE
jgi:ATP-dependent helicase/nuclease subunit A